MNNLTKKILLLTIIFPFLIQATAFADAWQLAVQDNQKTTILSPQGLPTNIVPIKIYADQKDNFYLTTREHGLFSKTGTNSWISKNSPDFHQRTYNGKSSLYRKISAFAINPLNQNELILATKHTLYKSQDKGKSWKRIKNKAFSSQTYITSLAFYQNKIICGTSHQGIFKITGKTFSKLNSGLPKEPYSKTLIFNEEIALLKIINGQLYTITGFEPKLLKYNLAQSKWQIVRNELEELNYQTILDLYFNNEQLAISSAQTLYLKNFRLQNLPKNALVFNKQSNFCYSTKKDSMLQPQAIKKQALYLSIHCPSQFSDKKLKEYKKAGIDAIVLDLKDDFGRIFFKSKNQQAQRSKAIRSNYKTAALLKKLHQNKFYVIARFVVFKDKSLYHTENYKFAIKDQRNKKPWKGLANEYWVDPFSTEVRDYNINLALELEAMGFDEIQFDYIRFPMDGPTKYCLYSYCSDKSTYKSEILASFLHEAQQKLTIPISTDIYGLTSWFRFGNSIGQDIEAFAQNVDTICPMVYPSHYGRRFKEEYSLAEKPYAIVYYSGLRAQAMTKGQANIRPYIQGFNYLAPTWGTDYILKQVKGCQKSKCEGFIFWNARGDYKTVLKGLKNLIKE